MTTIPLSVLLKDIASIQEGMDCPIGGLALDSRKVQPGSLFFAYKGTHLDGREYISDAIKNGAVAILVDSDQPSSIINKIPYVAIPNLQKQVGEIAARFYQYPAKAMAMVGITGTNGKTSCSHFVAAALDYLHKPCGIVGTLGCGLYGQVKEGSLTTPDAITLQKTFAELHNQGAQAISMEVSSHSLDQGRVNGIAFEVGIFTNLTRDHLDYHGTMENYGLAKKRLFDYSKYAVINADDAFGSQLIKSLRPSHQVYAYSVDGPQDVYVEHVKLDITGIRAQVYTPWGQGELHAHLVGLFNLSNVLATLTTLCLLKIPFKDALEAIAHLTSVPGRMQTLGGKGKPLVVVDYAHTPDALEKVLIALKQHCEGTLYCIFGCGGDRDKGKRPMMAKIAEQLADQVIVTDDNPRTENPDQIVNDIMSGFINPNQVNIQHDRSKAIQDVIQCAKAGDCVLVAGKGAETYQQIGDQKLPFSDVEKVKETLV